jgi:hypothetical protein
MELHRRANEAGSSGICGPRPSFLAVHRHNDTVYYKRLQPASSACCPLSRPGHGGRGLRATGGVAQADLGQVKSWFETWAALGWFCKLE